MENIDKIVASITIPEETFAGLALAIENIRKELEKELEKEEPNKEYIRLLGTYYRAVRKQTEHMISEKIKEKDIDPFDKRYGKIYQKLIGPFAGIIEAAYTGETFIDYILREEASQKNLK